MMWLIAKREFRTRTLSKANILSGSIMVFLIVAGAFIAKPFLTDMESEPDVVSVAHDTADLLPYLETSAEVQGLDLVFGPEVLPEFDGLPEGIRAFVSGPAEAPDVALESEDPQIVQAVTAATQAFVLDAQVTELGGDPATVSTALAQAQPTVTLVGGSSRASS